MMTVPVRRPPVEIGARFGRLVVEAGAGRDAKSNRVWVASCDCGNRITCRDDLLRGGRSRSCGCLRRARVPPPPQPYDEVDDRRVANRTLTLVLTPEDVAMLRAVALLDGREVDDPGGVLLHLLRQCAERRGLGHVVGKHDAGATARASQAIIARKAEPRRRSRSSPMKSAEQGRQIEAGA